MRLLRLRSAWGLAGLRSGDRRALFAKLRSEGWDGVEGSLLDIGGDAAERKDCVAAAQAEQFQLVLSAYSSWHNYEGPYDALSSTEDHARAIGSEFREIAELHGSSITSPILRINAHSGSDAWTEDEAVDFFTAVQSDIRGLGEALPNVSHETHRGRYLCCPFATARLLARVPSLRLTSDFSHWVVKCERLLDTPEERDLLDEIIAPAVDHVHARIGTPQAPQVADPSHVTVRSAAQRHYDWWESVWSARERMSISGRDATLSATLEYGPVEFAGPGHEEYAGYTPVGLKAEPVSGLSHEALLLTSRAALDDRFAAWHGGPKAAQRQGGW